jgi:hypothetical protein
MQVKGTGVANTCPTLDSGSSNIKDLKAGTYALGKFCMEPTSFTVKEESQVGAPAVGCCCCCRACSLPAPNWQPAASRTRAAAARFGGPSCTQRQRREAAAPRSPTATSCLTRRRSAPLPLPHPASACLQFKGGDSDFVATRLMTRLTYTLDEVSRAMTAANCAGQCSACCYRRVSCLLLCAPARLRRQHDLRRPTSALGALDSFPAELTRSLPPLPRR